MAIAMAYNMGIAQFNYTSNSFAKLKKSARLAQNCRELRGCDYKMRLRMNIHQVKAAVNGDIIRDGADDHNRKKIVAQQLDHWLHNSVAEIVKNIGEAPFLVHIYTDNNGLGSSPSSPPPPSSYSARNMKFVIEKTTQEAWPIIKQRWESSYSEIPHGIIFVGQLESKDKQQEQHDKSTSTSSKYCTSNNQIMSSRTKLWGVLVQGRDQLHFPACYLLKTCQVQCCFGFSTHFCLAKVDNFGICCGDGATTFDFHLNKMWLQR